MIFTSTSAFLAVLVVVLAAVLAISRFPRVRRDWPWIAAAAFMLCCVFLSIGFVALGHEQRHARAQLRTDTRFVAGEVVQAEQQKLQKEGAYGSISSHGKVSVEVTAVDGTHATAHVWSKQASFRFKITPQGATPDPLAQKAAAVSGSAAGR